MLEESKCNRPNVFINSFAPACAKYRADLIDGQYTQLVHYNSASVHQTGPKIPPFDSTRNYLFEYTVCLKKKGNPTSRSCCAYINPYTSIIF